VRTQVDRDLTLVSRVDRQLRLIKNLGRHRRRRRAVVGCQSVRSTTASHHAKRGQGHWNNHRGNTRRRQQSQPRRQRWEIRSSRCVQRRRGVRITTKLLQGGMRRWRHRRRESTGNISHEAYPHEGRSNHRRNPADQHQRSLEQGRQ
jgi:hypothetical protein